MIKVVGIVIVTHGHLGKEFIKTSEMIMGKQEKLISVNLMPEDGLGDLRQKVLWAVEKVETQKGVLVLTDILGGSPTNASCQLTLINNIKVITGINVPMLLEVLANRKKSLDEIAKIAYKAGSKGIKIIQVESKEGVII